MKKLAFLIPSVFFTLFISSYSFAQRYDVNKISTMKTNFVQIRELVYDNKYDGKILQPNEYKKKLKTLQDNISNANWGQFKDFPVLHRLVQHFNAVSIERIDSACSYLKEGYNSFLAIDTLFRSDNVKKLYKDNYDIDHIFFENLYKHELLKKMKCITKEQILKEYNDVKQNKVNNRGEKDVPDGGNKKKANRNNKEDEQELNEGKNNKNTEINTPDNNIKLSIGDESATIVIDNITYSDENVVALLRSVIRRNLLDDKDLEITQLIGDEREFIDGLDKTKTQYSVKFKHSDLSRIMYFNPAQYIINDNGSDNLWENYKNGRNKLMYVIVNVIANYGDSAFDVFIEGSADSPVFNPKKLLPEYNFKNITVIDKYKLKTEIINIGDTYDNTELPDLRACFIQDRLLRHDIIASDRTKQLKNKFRIIRGIVKPKHDVTQRNCSIVIAIDWEHAQNYAEKVQKKR